MYYVLFNGNEIGFAIRNGGIWFVGEDICRVLGYKAVADSLRYYVKKSEKGKSERIPANTPNRTTTVTLIDKHLLYDILNTSQKPLAQELKKWVKAFFSKRLKEVTIVLKSYTFGKVRIIIDNEKNQLWISARDIGELVGYSRGRTFARDIKGDGLSRMVRIKTPSGVQKAKFIRIELALDLLKGSIKPLASKVRKWIEEEMNEMKKNNIIILSTTRKKQVKNETIKQINDLDKIIEIFRMVEDQFKKVEEKYTQLEAENKNLKSKIEEYERILKKLKHPRVLL